MLKMMTAITIAITSVFFLGCTQNKHLSKIKCVNISFFDNTFESTVPITPDHFDKIRLNKMLVDDYGVIDTIIYEDSILYKIEKQMERFKPYISDSPIDVRIRCELIYRNNESKVFYICGIYSEQLFYNGAFQKIDKNILYIIKSNIGFYDMIPVDYLSTQVELSNMKINKDS